ncbi:MAG: hypothetical protein IT186_16700 [Acidobacteria bacterium]|nr:hypothetical protein [Acidobacteriota bacterium]
MAPRPCEQAPTRSTNGIIETVSTLPGWGYLGVELTKAPLAPGTYYVKVESIGQTHRIRIAADRWDEAGGVANEFAGSFVVCKVQGIEIVDTNFRVADGLIFVGAPKQYRARFLGIAGEVLPTEAWIATTNQDGTPADSLSGLIMTRVGSSSMALSLPFTLEPPVEGIARKTLANGTSVTAGKGVTGKLSVTASGQTVTRDTEPEVVVELTLFDAKAQMVSRDVQRRTGLLICPDADDDDLDNTPDYNMARFPVNPTDSAGRALFGRKREDTVHVLVTKTAKPSDTAKLMIRGTTNGDSALHLYSMTDGTYVPMPYQIPWEKVTQGGVDFFAETAGPNPLELTLYMENGPAVPDDKAMFHGCDGKYFYIAGAGHEDSSTHYIQGFRHSFQSQRLCGFTDMNVTTGDTTLGIPTGDIGVISSLYDHGVAGLPTSDIAYQKVQQVLSSTAAARAAGNAAIVGYSYGATVTAAAAVEAKRLGQPFSFCAVIGPPIGPMLTDLIQGALGYPKACGEVVIENIPGDAIQAGAPSFGTEARALAGQLFLGAIGALNPFSAPHFAYAQDLNDRAMQRRRDDLITAWTGSGVLAVQCLPTQ